MSKNKQKDQAATTAPSALHDAIEQTPDVKGHYCKGLQALEDDSSKIIVPQPRLIGGSLNIDKAVKGLYPDEARWDYALEYDGATYFVEVHPAFTGEVDKMKKKLAWLQNWLKTKAPEIDKLKSSRHPYAWVYTGTFAIMKTSKQYKQLAQMGLLPTSSWDFEKMNKT